MTAVETRISLWVMPSLWGSAGRAPSTASARSAGYSVSTGNECTRLRIPVGTHDGPSDDGFTWDYLHGSKPHLVSIFHDKG